LSTFWLSTLPLTTVVLGMGLVGYGCFIGIGKLARISKGMNAAELETAVNGYFTLDNLHAAKGLVRNNIDN